MAVVDEPIIAKGERHASRSFPTVCQDRDWAGDSIRARTGGSGIRHIDDDDDDFAPMREGGDSPQPVETETGQKAASTHQDQKRLALLGNNDNDFEPVRKGRTSAHPKTEMGQRTVLAHPVLTLLDNNSSENEQVKPRGSRYEAVVQRTITNTYKRKRRGPDKSEIAHKPMLIDSGSSSSSSDAKSDKEDDYAPPTKRGRPTSLKTSKSKRGRQPGSKSTKNKEDGIGSSEPSSDFNIIKSFRSFKVIVGGSAIDGKLLPIEPRRAYHGLCHDRKSLLHGRIHKPICPLLAAGVIIEKVRIAEGIRASAASPSRENLARWKKALESFEMMGMDVGFMRECVNGLTSLLDAADHQHEGYKVAKLEWDRAAKELTALESKLTNIKDALKEIDMELQEMAASSAKKKKNVDQAARQLAAAPW